MKNLFNLFYPIINLIQVKKVPVLLYNYTTFNIFAL
jgi:hypothetical protein